MNYKILINKENKYQSSDFCNLVLVKYHNIVGEEILVEKKTLQEFLSLQKKLQEQGCKIDITSGYRSIEEQEKIYQEIKEEYGSSYANSFVAPPGSSEHHSGLCIDIGLVEDNKLIDDNNTLTSDMYISILEDKVIPCLKEFGFILRYPKTKESITGYSYEPWHYRYVGKHTAFLIEEKSLTLEQYHELYQKSGILIVNKPKGITSRDVVNQIGKIFDTKKVGHNGTLDPLAEGVLVITINKATKINELLIAAEKEYIANVQMGIETDTLDIEGKIINKQDVSIKKEEVERLLQDFNTEYLQEVPIYAAVKVKGKKLYEYARNNEKVELPKKMVKIENMQLLSFDQETFSFSCTVSKGTYIRSLIRDIGKKLGICCTMENLIRTRQGIFSINKAVELENITIQTPILKIEEVLPYEIIELDDKTYQKVKNGMALDNCYDIKDKVIFAYQKKIVAIYQNVNEKLKVFKML